MENNIYEYIRKKCEHSHPDLITKVFRWAFVSQEQLSVDTVSELSINSKLVSFRSFSRPSLLR